MGYVRKGVTHFTLRASKKNSENILKYGKCVYFYGRIMATNDKKDNSLFSTRLEIRGENAEKVRKVLDAKMKKDSRKTYTNAIEAIIIEYGIEKGSIKEGK